MAINSGRCNEHVSLLVKPDSVRIIFGEKVQGGVLKFHSANTMSRETAEHLIKLLRQKLDETSGARSKAVTVTGGTLH